jgi:hypothetical protein
MKSIAAIFVVVLFTASSLSAQKVRASKTYSVTLTVDEWNTAMQTINNAREIMKKSTFPANVVSDWSDSLLSVQLKLSSQIQDQMRKDGSMPSLKEMEKHSVPIQEDKADSTKPKSPQK